jgi:hypothetical protein
LNISSPQIETPTEERPMNPEHMPLRGRAYMRLRAELDRQGALHRHELELLLDAADGLLFDEPESLVRRAKAVELLDRLEAAGRRTASEASRLRDALSACAAPPSALAA